MTYNPNVSPRLADMVRRCALPISVKPMRTAPNVWIGWRDEDGVHTSIGCTWAEATSAYLALVSALTNPGAPSSLPGTAADCSAPSPGGV